MMFQRRSFVLGFASACALLFATVVVSGVSNAGSKGPVFCVNTKTKVLTYPGSARCGKGTKAVASVAQGLTGPKGDPGPQGLRGWPGVPGASGAPGSTASYSVLDQDGNNLGQLIGSYSGSNLPAKTLTVLQDGVVVTYGSMGEIQTSGAQYFSFAEDCTGPKYWPDFYLLGEQNASAVWPIFMRNGSGMTSGEVQVLVPATSEPVSDPQYYWDGSVCFKISDPSVVDSMGILPIGAKLKELTLTATLHDATGPLRIMPN